MNQPLVNRLIGPALVCTVFFISPGCGPENPAGPSKKGFEFTLSEASDSKTVPAVSLADFHITVKNHGPSADSLCMLINRETAFPDSNWSASYCMGQQCFLLFGDSASAGQRIAAGSSDSVTIDFSSGNSGTAGLHVRLWNRSDTTQSFERTFTCTVQ